VMKIMKSDYRFENFEDVNQYFRKVINQLKQMNYSVFQSDDFNRFEQGLEHILAEKRIEKEKK